MSSGRFGEFEVALRRMHAIIQVCTPVLDMAYSQNRLKADKAPLIFLPMRLIMNVTWALAHPNPVSLGISRTNNEWRIEPEREAFCDCRHGRCR